MNPKEIAQRLFEVRYIWVDDSMDWVLDTWLMWSEGARIIDGIWVYNEV